MCVVAHLTHCWAEPAQSCGHPDGGFRAQEASGHQNRCGQRMYHGSTSSLPCLGAPGASMFSWKTCWSSALWPLWVVPAPWWQALAPRVDWALPFFAGIYCAITHWSQLPSRVCLGGGGGGGRNFLEEDERSENLGQETQPGVRSVLKITQWAAQDVPPDS